MSVGEPGSGNGIETALEKIKRGQRELEEAQALQERARRDIEEGEKELERLERSHEPSKISIYFVSGKEYETDQPALTGLQIKAKVANWDPSHDLVLEGVGDEPDQVIRDDESVRFLGVHPARRFSSVPKANFG